MILSRYVVPALAFVLFTSACARHAQHQARPVKATTATPVVVNVPKAEVTVAPTEIGPIRAKKFNAFPVFQEEGENKGKCTAGVVAGFVWHKANHPRLEGAVLDAIEKLEAAKASWADKETIKEAGEAVRKAYDLNMPTVLNWQQNYGNFACEVPGTPKMIIGSDQIPSKAETIKAYVKNEPDVPARAK